MKIDYLKLKNFKNYESLEATFQPGINLLVGVNGSGKTSILEALCVAAGAFFNGEKSIKEQRLIEINEVRIVKSGSESVRQPEATVEAQSGIFQEYGIAKTTWARTIKTATRSNDNKGTEACRDFGQYFLSRFSDPEDQTVAPIIAYSSTLRLYKDAALTRDQQYNPNVGRMNGYLLCLSDAAMKAALIDWLSKASATRVTRQIKGIEDTNLVLENVEEAIRRVLIRCLNKSDDFQITVYPNAEYENELFVAFDSQDLPLSYYSDGYRNIIFLFMDLIWRCSLLNPWLRLDELREKAFGVVMIDEIDLHLHPRWQGMVLTLLQEMLPNVQFFITTHSPTVVANFQPRPEKDALYRLDDSSLSPVEEHFFGKEVQYVLYHILGANDRNPTIQEKIDKLLRLVDGGVSNEAEYTPLLEALTLILGENDADIQRILSMIDWNKYLAEQNDAVH